MSITTGAITSMKRIRIQLTRLMPCWNCVGAREVCVTRPANWPKYVSEPVATTSALPAPLTTLVPMKAMFSSSSGLADCTRGDICFSTGSDSPVSAACATKRSLAFRMRQSAGTMSPAESSTTSPGTRSASGTSRCCDPVACKAAPKKRRPLPASGDPASLRRTVAVLRTIAFRASAARFERCSCTKRSTVEISTIEPMIATAVQDWSSGAAMRTSVSHDRTASAVSSRLNGLR